MQQELKIYELPKLKPSLSRTPNLTKYFISCQSKITKETPSTESWLKILKLLKIDIHDTDKSRILLGSLEKYGTIVVKLGSVSDLEHEYNFSRMLFSSKGFVKYICYFSCNDDFRAVKNQGAICKGPGNQMGIILMPYFPLGSIAKFAWSFNNLHVLQSCLKHAIISVLIAFANNNIIHGDFHPGNVLLKETKQTEITYEYNNESFTIPLFGIRPWIMDFENSSVANFDSGYERIVSFNNFYIDFNKFLPLLSTFQPNIDSRTFIPIQSVINKPFFKSEMMTGAQLTEIMHHIDKISMFS